jgi:hypothetical protein
MFAPAERTNIKAGWASQTPPAKPGAEFVNRTGKEGSTSFFR